VRLYLSLHETPGVNNFAAMFRAREAEHRVIYGYQEVSMGSFETARQRSFVQILNDIVAHELPKLAR
jgi:hypothetical protein